MASPKFHSTFVDGLLQQGEVKSKSEDLIKVIKARGLELTKAQLNLVTSCADLSQLATWFDQALDAKTPTRSSVSTSQSRTSTYAPPTGRPGLLGYAPMRQFQTSAQANGYDPRDAVFRSLMMSLVIGLLAAV